MVEQHHIDAAKATADAASIAAVLGWMAGLLPAFATFASLIYMLIRIYETPTVQGLIKRYKERHAKD